VTVGDGINTGWTSKMGTGESVSVGGFQNDIKAGKWGIE